MLTAARLRRQCAVGVALFLDRLIAVIAGGIIWGAAGMILFVPFAAILKLIADSP